MDVTEILNEMRIEASGCELVAFADLSSRMMLCVSPAGQRPQEELDVLAYLVTTRRRAFSAEFNDRRLIPLVSKGWLQKGGGTNRVLEWPYVVQKDVWEFLVANEDQFRVDNADAIPDPFNWRA